MKLTRGEATWLVRRRIGLSQSEYAHELLGISEDRLRRRELDREAAPLPNDVERAALAEPLSYGEFFALQRRRAGVGQRALGARVGMSRLAVNKAERDRSGCQCLLAGVHCPSLPVCGGSMLRLYWKTRHPKAGAPAPVFVHLPLFIGSPLA